MKQWFPAILWLSFFLVILYFVWSLVPCCVDPDVPGYHWALCTCFWPHLPLQVCGMCQLNPVAAQRDNYGMVPTSYFVSELQFSPLPMGGWDNSAQTLPAGDGNISPASQAVGLCMNNVGSEWRQMESQCLRLFFLCLFTGLGRIAPLLAPSNDAIIWQNPVLYLF